MTKQFREIEPVKRDPKIISWMPLLERRNEADFILILDLNVRLVLLISVAKEQSKR